MFSYEWDHEKNKKNFKKQGIWFEEAVTVFQDPLLRIAGDRDSIEERYIAIGKSLKYREVLVVHCYRQKESEEVIRIISARKLTPKEKRLLAKLQPRRYA